MASLEPQLPKLRLPPEIVHEILRYASQLSTQFARNLCSVSSWTRIIALPILYSVVLLKNHSDNKLFLEALRRQPFSTLPLSKQFLPGNESGRGVSGGAFNPKDHVYAIKLEVSSNKVVDIYQNCPNLTHIALIPENLLWLMIFPTHRQDDFDILLTRKPAAPDILNPPSVPTPIWQSILPHAPNTNAAAAGGPANPPEPLAVPFYSQIRKLRLPLLAKLNADLTSFPRLTHLAVPFAYPTQDTQSLDAWLEHPSLEVLVVVLMNTFASEVETRRINEWMEGVKRRVVSVKVALISSESQDLVTDWETEMRGGKSIWSTVDD